jgi:hypothetical protein
MKQIEFDQGTREIGPSRYVATERFWALVRDCEFDPESFVPSDPKQHALAHAIKGDTEFATDDKHGPLHGPLIGYLLKHQAQRVKTAELGEVHLARRVIIPSRNLTVWVYAPIAEDALREYHSSGNLL